MDESRKLDQGTFEALGWDDADRIHLIREMKNRWIPYPRANALMQMAEEFLNRPPSGRMECLLVHAEPDSGKTMLQKRYCAKHAIDKNPNGDALRAQVIGIELHGPVIGDFYDSILLELNAPFRFEDSNAKKLHQVMTILARVGTRQLVIDELNTAIAGHTVLQRTFMVGLKYLLNKLRLTVFATGTDDARAALAIDKQINSRFKHHEELTRWANDVEFRRLLEGFERGLPLRKRSGLQAPNTARMVHELSEGYLGEVARLLMDAAVLAIKTKKECIDRNLLQSLHSSTPSQTRLAARARTPVAASS